MKLVVTKEERAIAEKAVENNGYTVQLTRLMEVCGTFVQDIARLAMSHSEDFRAGFAKRVSIDAKDTLTLIAQLPFILKKMEVNNKEIIIKD